MTPLRSLGWQYADEYLTSSKMWTTHQDGLVMKSKVSFSNLSNLSVRFFEFPQTYLVGELLHHFLKNTKMAMRQYTTTTRLNHNCRIRNNCQVPVTTTVHLLLWANKPYQLATSNFSMINLPMRDMHSGLMMPLGSMWKSYALSPTTTVWPALLPPCTMIKIKHSMLRMTPPLSHTLDAGWSETSFLKKNLLALWHILVQPSM